MFATRLHHPAAQLSRNATWQGCVVADVAGMDRSFGGCPGPEINASVFGLLENAGIAPRKQEAHL